MCEAVHPLLPPRLSGNLEVGRGSERLGWDTGDGIGRGREAVRGRKRKPATGTRRDRKVSEARGDREGTEA